MSLHLTCGYVHFPVLPALCVRVQDMSDIMKQDMERFAARKQAAAASSQSSSSQQQVWQQ
jgi:pyrrolidone-carboxylate peptidase